MVYFLQKTHLNFAKKTHFETLLRIWNFSKFKSWDLFSDQCAKKMSHCAQCTNSLNIYLCKPYVRRPSKQSKEVLKYLHTAYAAPKVISNAHWGHNFDQVPNTEQCAKHCLLIDGFVSRRLCRRVCSSIFFQNVNKEIAHVLKMQGNNDDETFSCDFLKLFLRQMCYE